MRNKSPRANGPDEFEKKIRDGMKKEEEAPGSGIKFTNGKDATEIVIPQYEKGFLRLMGEASEMTYTELGWEDEEVQTLARAFAYAHAKGALASLETLHLGDNAIGRPGFLPLLSAHAWPKWEGALASLETLGFRMPLVMMLACLPLRRQSLQINGKGALAALETLDLKVERHYRSSLAIRFGPNGMGALSTSNSSGNHSRPRFLGPASVKIIDLDGDHAAPVDKVLREREK